MLTAFVVLLKRVIHGEVVTVTVRNGLAHPSINYGIIYGDSLSLIG